MSLPVTAVTSTVLHERLQPAHWWARRAWSRSASCCSRWASGEPGRRSRRPAFAVALWVGVAAAAASWPGSGVHWPGPVIGALAGLGYTGSAVAVRGAESPISTVGSPPRCRSGSTALLGFWLYSVGARPRAGVRRPPRR